jgi:hypothetical protein
MFVRNIKTEGSLEVTVLDAMVSNLISLCKKLLQSETLNVPNTLRNASLIGWACQSGAFCLTEIDGRAISKTYLK